MHPFVPAFDFLIIHRPARLFGKGTVKAYAPFRSRHLSEDGALQDSVHVQNKIIFLFVQPFPKSREGTDGRENASPPQGAFQLAPRKLYNPVNVILMDQ